MKWFLRFVISGLALLLTGIGSFALATSGGQQQTETQSAIAAIGLLMSMFGALVMIVGFLIFAFQKPSPKAVAKQNSGNYGNWHFRPIGLILFVIGFVTAAWLAASIEPLIPGNDKRKAAVLGKVILIGYISLLSIRQVRELIFYSGKDE